MNECTVNYHRFQWAVVASLPCLPTWGLGPSLLPGNPGLFLRGGPAQTGSWGWLTKRLPEAVGYTPPRPLMNLFPLIFKVALEGQGHKHSSNVCASAVPGFYCFSQDIALTGGFQAALGSLMKVSAVGNIIFLPVAEDVCLLCCLISLLKIPRQRPALPLSPLVHDVQLFSQVLTCPLYK